MARAIPGAGDRREISPHAIGKGKVRRQGVKRQQDHRYAAGRPKLRRTMMQSSDPG